jgi:hypothetical protein
VFVKERKKKSELPVVCVLKVLSKRNGERGRKKGERKREREKGRERKKRERERKKGEEVSI